MTVERSNNMWIPYYYMTFLREENQPKPTRDVLLVKYHDINPLAIDRAMRLYDENYG